MIALTALSPGYSVYQVAMDPEAAYFVTFIRAGEFGEGVLLTVFAANLLISRRYIRAVVGWLGIAIIAVTLTFYSVGTPFRDDLLLRLASNGPGNHSSTPARP